MMTPLEKQWMDQVDDLISEKLDRGENILVMDIAHAFHLSERQVFRRVKRITGQTPNQYIQSHRLALARKLMKSPSADLDQVASRVGYKRSDYLRRLLSEEKPEAFTRAN